MYVQNIYITQIRQTYFAYYVEPTTSDLQNIWTA